MLVLNAYDTLDGAEDLLPAVLVIIAMADAMYDIAAALFAIRFYEALASGQSVASAYNQGVVALRIAASPDADLPRVVNRDDVHTANLILVKAATS